MFAIWIALLGCETTKTEDSAKKKTEPKEKPARVIVMAIDDTGSYSLWDQAKNIACGIIMQLDPGDIFYFRRITAASYTDDCTVFRLELPLNKACLSG